MWSELQFFVIPPSPSPALAYHFLSRTGTFLNTLDTAQMLVLEIKAFLCFSLTLAWFAETSSLFHLQGQFRMEKQLFSIQHSQAHPNRDEGFGTKHGCE